MPSATVEAWHGRDVPISGIERQLARMRAPTPEESGRMNQRTSVMTHVAWVPPEWVEAAERTLDGMEESHPSRTIVLVPLPEEASAIDVTLDVRSFAAGDRAIASEVIWLRLGGERAAAPASLVLPLSAGVDMGRASIVRVRVRARDGWVRFSADAAP